MNSSENKKYFVVCLHRGDGKYMREDTKIYRVYRQKKAAQTFAEKLWNQGLNAVVRNGYNFSINQLIQNLEYY